MTNVPAERAGFSAHQFLLTINLSAEPLRGKSPRDLDRIFKTAAISADGGRASYGVLGGEAGHPPSEHHRERGRLEIALVVQILVVIAVFITEIHEVLRFYKQLKLTPPLLEFEHPGG
jgi:hypothetical protein